MFFYSLIFAQKLAEMKILERIYILFCSFRKRKNNEKQKF